VSDRQPLISKAFQSFQKDTPDHAKAWGELVVKLAQASALDAKTGQLVYLAVLAALGRASGIPFHVRQAKETGASREEVLSAILTGLPAAGHVVTQSLPAAIEAYDAE